MANAPAYLHDRSLEGLRVEYEIALREGKPTVARAARDKAIRLASATNQVCPTWAQGWGP